jgi:hypothetical protein
MGLTACDDVTSLDDLPYVERLVVAGVVESGTSVEVFFSRTMPPNEVFQPDQAALADVSGAFEVGGTSYPLLHVGSGVYRATGLSLSPGHTCRLKAAWNGREISATTVIPPPPIVDSAVAVVNAPAGGATTLRAYLKGRAGECYGLTYQLNFPSGSATGGYFTTMSRAVTDGAREVLEEPYSYSPGSADTVYAVVHGYDGPFYDYFISRGGNTIGHDDLLFAASTGYVNWNVEGDGIGLFIGHAVIRVQASKR